MVLLISFMIAASSVSSRRSSLISVSSNGSSAMATSVTSGMSRSPSSAYPQSPDLIPPIDPIAIVEIENQARLVADSLDLMMGNLRSNLHNVSTETIRKNRTHTKNHPKMSHLMPKSTKWHVRPAKTQISLGICPV